MIWAHLSGGLSRKFACWVKVLFKGGKNYEANSYSTMLLLVWKEMNRLMFNNQATPFKEVVVVIKVTVARWALVRKELRP